MRLVIQRVSRAKVTIDGIVKGEIGRGFAVLVGVSAGDSPKDAEYLAEKCVNLRIFNDDDGKMNLSLKDVHGAILSISQFTLYADTRKGRRPSFIRAADPELGRSLYDYFNERIESAGIQLETGVFGAMMDIELVNEGPVTIIVDSSDSATNPNNGGR